MIEQLNEDPEPSSSQVSFNKQEINHAIGAIVGRVEELTPSGADDAKRFLYKIETINPHPGDKQSYVIARRYENTSDRDEHVNWFNANENSFPKAEIEILHPDGTDYYSVRSTGSGDALIKHDFVLMPGEDGDDAYFEVLSTPCKEATLALSGLLSKMRERK